MCAPVGAVTFPLPPEGDDLVGDTFTYTAVYEDTFSDIARFYDLGFRQLKAANPKIDPWVPGEGAVVTIPQQYILPPGPRKDIVINLAELRLYYFPKDRNEVITYPIGIGREGWTTPVGEANVISKKKDPVWTPPESILQEHAAKGDPLPKVVPAGPDNPLGQHALYLSMRGYLMHGTNKPYGVGMRVSHGCMRLYPEDIAKFFEQVPIGTHVRIINEPFKAGWHQGKLYISAHPPLTEQVEEEGLNYTGLISAVLQKIGDDPRKPDWTQFHPFLEKLTGVPLLIDLVDDVNVQDREQKTPPVSPGGVLNLTLD